MNKVIMFVSFTESPYFEYAPLETQEQFEHFDTMLKKDPLPSYTNIYQIGDDAWIVIGHTLKHCRLLATIRLMVDIGVTASRIRNLATTSGFEMYSKPAVDSILDVFNSPGLCVTADQFMQHFG